MLRDAHLRPCLGGGCTVGWASSRFRRVEAIASSGGLGCGRRRGRGGICGLGFGCREVGDLAQWPGAQQDSWGEHGWCCGGGDAN